MAQGLTPRQARFVEEYLIDLNGTQAAIRAGYAPGSADVEAARLLGNARVAAEIERAKAERSARIGLHADRVLEELSVVAFARLSDFAEWDGDHFDLKPSSEVDARAVLQVKHVKKHLATTEGGDVVLSTEQSVKLHDKLAALKLLGQHLGMFQDSVKLDATETFVKALREFGHAPRDA